MQSMRVCLQFSFKKKLHRVSIRKLNLPSRRNELAELLTKKNVQKKHFQPKIFFALNEKSENRQLVAMAVELGNWYRRMRIDNCSFERGTQFNK